MIKSVASGGMSAVSARCAAAGLCAMRDLSVVDAWNGEGKFLHNKQGFP